MNESLLREFARKYIWWKTVDEALVDPERITLQVMDIGVYEDIVRLLKATSEDYLRKTLLNAQAGALSARSWCFWHYRLGLAKTAAEVPPLPARRCFDESISLF